MLNRLRRAITPSMAVSLLALFVALGGAGIAATGGNFVLGTLNEATTPTELRATGTSASALKVTNANTAPGSTALELVVPAGKAPLEVNRRNKVDNLNADLIDGLDATAFVPRGTAISHDVTTASGVVDVTNTGSGNGVQGKTTDVGGSAVYGEHVGAGGFGIAGRAGDFGNAVYGDNVGSGFAGYFEDKVHVSGKLELGGSLDCTGCVSAGDVTGRVGDADKLDGIDSAGFMQAAQGGSSDGQAVAIAPNGLAFLGPPVGGLILLRYACPSPIGGNGTLRIYNSSAGAANLFVDSGGANPDYFGLASGGVVDYPAAAGGESFFIQMQGAPGVALVSVATVHRNSSNDCHAQAFGTIAG